MDLCQTRLAATRSGTLSCRFTTSKEETIELSPFKSGPGQGFRISSFEFKISALLTVASQGSSLLGAILGEA